MSNIKIIYFEGLLGIFGRWLCKGLISRIEQEYPRVKIERKHWLFSRRKINDPEAIVIGHSFGAAAALKRTVRCKALITLDCRTGFSSNYQVNNRGVKCYNFYQKYKGFPGYKIRGAYHEEEVHFVNHVDLPKEYVVWQYTKMIIEGGN